MFPFLVFVISLLLLDIDNVLGHMPQHGYFELNSGRTLYAITKDYENGKRIVLIHGIGGDHSSYHSWSVIFSSHGFQALSYDLLGHGLSDWKLDGLFTQERYVAQLNELLKEVGWVDQNNEPVTKFVILGSSMGGMIAAKYALTYPHHLSSLIMLSPPGMMSREDDPFLYDLSSSWLATRLKDIHKYKHRFRMGLFFARLFGFIHFEDMSKEEKKKTIENCHRLATIYVKSGAKKAFFDKHYYYKELSELEDKVKMLFIWGIHDDIVPLAPAIDFLSKHFNKTSIVVYPKIKHIAMYDIVSPAFVSLKFLETNDTVGVPIKDVKNVDFFYHNRVNIIQGLNYTYSGRTYRVRIDPDLNPREYIDFT
ncbi:Alpha/beta hydrolase family protein [Cryptosporidium felis]|nr:Alpha/beta hydrolase family protein [Cryptosporidium felis]